MALTGEASRGNEAARLLADYRPLAGAPDELLKADGSIRPVWADLVNAISHMPEKEITRRTERGNQYLRDAGVYYRQYGADQADERDWPLSHMPVLIAEAEWDDIAEGLIQRADLLERVAADMYGENRLVADGHLPAALVAENPEWLRPLVGVTPQSGHFLHFIAFDIGRGPTGDWWVLGDRTQAPSGAGFALENRIATARVYGDLYARSNVHRLAGFFRTFRDALLGLREDHNSRVGILTPGPLNDTYYEQAYIARYLGFMLLEGEDLTSRNGELMVRTVAGLKPISVLWRRLDSTWADPLELEESSRIGTPGMLSTVRNGKLTLVNALGTGVLEARALLAFLPSISRVLSGQDLLLPNIATWWCGQAAEREYVLANAANMSISDAFATRPVFEKNDVLPWADKHQGTTPEQLLTDHIAAHADGLVGQEAIRLSTTPAFDGFKLVPRPMSLRVFLARTPSGWQVMPGGFARIGDGGETTALAMQLGGSSADVWVVSDRPVATETMLPHQDKSYVRQQPGVLPSRAADNLFWLGRYVERAENIIRLLRAFHVRLAEAANDEPPLLVDLARHLKAMDTELTHGMPDSVQSTVTSAILAAGHVRDRFSVDGWLALNDLSKTVSKMSSSATDGDDMARAMGILLRKLSGFSGLVNENMYRFTGWRFLSIGRSLERAAFLSALLAHFADEEAAPDGALELAVEVADSAMSHRRRYAVATNRSTVVDLLALDPLNPRSVLYQLNEIHEHIGFLPGSEGHRQLTGLQRVALKCRSGLAVQTPESLSTEQLQKLGEEIGTLSDLLAASYFQ